MSQWKIYPIPLRLQKPQSRHESLLLNQLARQEPVGTDEPIETEVPSTDEPELVCAKLLTPTDGIQVPAVGVVTFSWEPVDGAEKYILKF